MSVTTILRKALPHLDVVRHATPILCEHRLALKAHALETRDGLIFGPRFNQQTFYTPYYAAHPVAPHIAGLRTAGFRASALWGASLAVSLLRNEAPNFTVYYHSFIGASVFERRPRAAPADPDAEDKEPSLWEEVRPYLPYVPLALSAWELLFGSGLSETPALHRGPQQYAWYEVARRPGLTGLGLKKIVESADAHRDTTLEPVLLGAACVLTTLNQVPRVVSVVLAGIVAGLGAGFGLAYELSTRLAVRIAGVGAPHTMQQALTMQRDAMRAQMRELDDTVLPAPLISALWRGRTAHEPNTNYWSNLTQAAADLLEHANDPRMAFFARAMPRRWEYLAQPMQAAQQPAGPARGPRRAGDVPLAREAGEGTQNVHAAGRDAATRRSIARLLQDDPVTDRDIQRAMDEVETALTAAPDDYRNRRHASGQAMHEAIACALFPTLNERVPQFYPAVNDATCVYHVEGYGAVPVRKIAAVVWRAIPEADRDERREAYLSALADAVDEFGYRVCSGGQSQRLVLVLQGVVPGVQIEAYDAPAPVPQFVTVVTQQIDGRLDEPTADAVKAAYDAAYLQGCAIYQGAKREELRNQLCACAQALYDVEWIPRY